MGGGGGGSVSFKLKIKGILHLASNFPEAILSFFLSCAHFSFEPHDIFECTAYARSIFVSSAKFKANSGKMTRKRREVPSQEQRKSNLCLNRDPTILL